MFFFFFNIFKTVLAKWRSRIEEKHERERKIQVREQKDLQKWINDINWKKKQLLRVFPLFLKKKEKKRA